MAGFRELRSKSVVLAQTNIDTDQIIPARFLSTTERAGLGRNAFNDWRWQADGSPNPEFPFNQPENQGRSILLAGRNFGWLLARACPLGADRSGPARHRQQRDRRHLPQQQPEERPGTGRAAGGDRAVADAAAGR